MHKKIYIILLMAFFVMSNIPVYGDSSGVIKPAKKSDFEVAAIHGRVYMNNTPTVGAHVIVTDKNIEKFYGEGITTGGRGPDSGKYQVTGLPSNKDLVVFAFHEEVPFIIAEKHINLKNNEFHELILTMDLRWTDPGSISGGSGSALGLGGFVLRITTLLNQSANSSSAQALIKKLQSISDKKEHKAIAGKSIVYILDTSGSMDSKIPSEGIRKIDAAKKALRKTLTYSKNEGKDNEYAMITYEGCSPVLSHGFSKDPSNIENSLSGIKAKGSTPIAKSLKMAIKQINDNSSSRFAQIILLSDGMETCGGDPVAVASKIKGFKPRLFRNNIEDIDNDLSFWDLFINKAYAEEAPTTDTKVISLSVIGFALKKGSKEEKALKRLAEAANGTYYTAKNLPELKEALRQSTDEKFDPTPYIVLGKDTDETAVTAPGTQKPDTGYSVNKIVLAVIVSLNFVLIGAVIFLLVRRSRDGYSARITLLGGRKSETRTVRGKLIVGRSNMSLDDISVSDKHFLVKKSGQSYIIQDLQSKNGTFLNKKRVDREILKDGDIIEAGKSVYLFNISVSN